MLRDRLRDILLADWDPGDASRSDAARGAYDAYLDPLIALLRAGADEEAVIDFLMERERESMCFPTLDRGPLRRVARKLVALGRSDDIIP